MLKFWSDIGFTFLLSYLLYLIIEAPFNGLDIFIRPRRKAPPTMKTQTNSEPTQEIQNIEDGSNITEELKDCDTVPTNSVSK